MNEQKYTVQSESETEKLGAALAKRLLDAGERFAFIALRGEMGVGKTAFTRGFCRHLGIDAVHSPTYTVVNEYKGGAYPVLHFDMYRIERVEELYSIGFEDYLAKDAYLLCEWSENIEPYLPPYAIFVTLTRTEKDGEREILIEDPSERIKL